MQKIKQALAGCVLAACAPLSWAQGETVTVEFSQSGFSSGGSISGFFRGTDLDGDGQIYAASRTISNLFGLPFGNELEYAEVTFRGFGDTPGSSKVVYDKSVFDMEDPRATFMSFAYNADGGAWGDEPDEGASIAIFSPSTNYLMGEAFSAVWESDAGQPFGACGSGDPCGVVLGYVPDEEAPTGARVTFRDFSSAAVDSAPRVPQQVPLSPQLSALIALLLAALGALFLRRRPGVPA